MKQGDFKGSGALSPEEKALEGGGREEGRGERLGRGTREGMSMGGGASTSGTEVSLVTCRERGEGGGRFRVRLDSGEVGLEIGG